MAFVSHLWAYFKISEPEKPVLHETEEEKQKKIREEEDEIVHRAETILRIRKEKEEKEQQLRENQEKITKKVLQLLSIIYQSKWKILFGNKAKVHLQRIILTRDAYLAIMDKSKEHIEKKRGDYAKKVGEGTMSGFHYYNLESQWAYKERRQKQILAEKNTAVQSATKICHDFIISKLDSILVSCSELFMYDIVRANTAIMEFITRSEQQVRIYKQEATWNKSSQYFPEEYTVLHSHCYDDFTELYVATEFDIPYSAPSYSRLDYCCA
jgi:hypothetical protein